jgi:hypothetical protein
VRQDQQAVSGKSEIKVVETEFPERVFWGDTHLHTANSVDAFGFGNRLGPEEALRFARGEEVTSSTGQKAKLARPLDFLVIADHAEGLGATKALYDAPRLLITDPTLRRWYDLMHQGPKGSLQATGEMLQARSQNKLPAGLNDPARPRSARARSGTITSIPSTATTNPASSPPSSASNTR